MNLCSRVPHASKKSALEEFQETLSASSNLEDSKVFLSFLNSFYGGRATTASVVNFCCNLPIQCSLIST